MWCNDVLNIFVFSKVSKHISIEAKHISSKKLNSISMANVIYVNLEKKKWHSKSNDEIIYN